MMNTVSTKKRTTMRLNACPRCGGSAYLENQDEEEWRCLQCGRSVPASMENDQQAAAPKAVA